MKDQTYADMEKCIDAEPERPMPNQLNRDDINSLNPGLKRRRLLKGAALIPAVFTLQSGSARAMLSSHRCIANTQTQPEKPFNIGDDKWRNVRIRNRVIKVVQAETSTTTLLIEGRIRFYDLSGNTWKLNGKDSEGFRLFLAPNGTVYKEVLGITPDVFARVYVNDEGQVVRVGSLGSRGAAVYDSCWTSFA
jgi:hypothetical protein